jgi:predicted phosphoribosyltransferase
MDAMFQPFENRQQAGVELALAMDDLKGTDSIVLAIPRGGVVVGYEVASALGLELDVIVPRKIPAPGQEELAIGAVASWGDHERIMDEHSVRFLGVSEDYIERQVQIQLDEVNRRLQAYRGTTEPPNVAGRNVILVDDGIATGYTTRAAAVALRRLGAGYVVLAVPVGPPDSIEMLRPFVDELICLRTPTPFMAVGYWYRDFRQVSDPEVIELLERTRSNPL